MDFYLYWLFGGFVATILFAVLGVHGSHAGHTGHAGQISHAGHSAGHTSTHSIGHAQAHAVAAPSSVGRFALTELVASAGGWTLSWISPLTCAAFALWFGAVGAIVERTASKPLLGMAVYLAVIAGLAGAVLVRAIMRALVLASVPPLSATPEGALGTLIAPIRADGVGEIEYQLEGTWRSMPCKNESGRPLPRGTQVVILRSEHGIAYVTPLNELAELPAPADKTPAGS